MRVLITGASGFIGSRIKDELDKRGDVPIKLIRNEVGSSPAQGKPYWDPSEGVCNLNGLEPVDAVINMAGETILGWWTDAKKKKIRDSRIKGTAALSRALAEMDRKPSVLVCASGCGIYGDRGDEILTEDSPTNRFHFLGQVGVEWESAAAAAVSAGIRVVHLRFGLVLSGKSGAFKTILMPFNFGLGSWLGSGKQWWPWISLEDSIAATLFCVDNDSLEGGVNIVAPDQITNLKFTKEIAKSLSRPALLGVPASVLKLLGGAGFAEDVLLPSRRVQPKKLSEAGFEWKHAEFVSALPEILNG